jgi:hypothetical protein
MPGLTPFIGKEVNLYGPESADHDGFIEAGTLLAAEDGFLLLAQGESRTPNVAVSLSHVMVIAIRDEEPQLRPIPGGKVHRFRREPGPHADRHGDDSPSGPSNDED